MIPYLYNIHNINNKNYDKHYETNALHAQNIILQQTRNLSGFS